LPSFFSTFSKTERVSLSVEVKAVFFFFVFPFFRSNQGLLSGQHCFFLVPGATSFETSLISSRAFLFRKRIITRSAGVFLFFTFSSSNKRSRFDGHPPLWGSSLLPLPFLLQKWSMVSPPFLLLKCQAWAIFRVYRFDGPTFHLPPATPKRDLCFPHFSLTMDVN